MQDSRKKVLEPEGRCIGPVIWQGQTQCVQAFMMTGADIADAVGEVWNLGQIGLRIASALASAQIAPRLIVPPAGLGFDVALDLVAQRVAAFLWDVEHPKILQQQAARIDFRDIADVRHANAATRCLAVKPDFKADAGRAGKFGPPQIEAKVARRVGLGRGVDRAADHVRFAPAAPRLDSVPVEE
jgi:hypothetical protein